MLKIFGAMSCLHVGIQVYIYSANILQSNCYYWTLFHFKYNKFSLIVKKVENIVAKGEIAHHEQFHLWPQCFQKSSAAISSKCVCRWERVYSKIILVYIPDWWCISLFVDVRRESSCSWSPAQGIPERFCLRLPRSKRPTASRVSLNCFLTINIHLYNSNKMCL